VRERVPGPLKSAQSGAETRVRSGQRPKSLLKYSPNAAFKVLSCSDFFFLESRTKLVYDQNEVVIGYLHLFFLTLLSQLYNWSSGEIASLLRSK